MLALMLLELPDIDLVHQLQNILEQLLLHLELLVYLLLLPLSLMPGLLLNIPLPLLMMVVPLPL
jgi:hypothetical protein